MKWEHVVDKFGQEAWIWGIYKINEYRHDYLDFPTYNAYFLEEWQGNWGNNVSTPPNSVQTSFGKVRYWATLEAAQDACYEHASHYESSEETKKRAEELAFRDWKVMEP